MTNTELSPEIRHTLARLRTRIRSYVWFEGLSLAIVWIGLIFWLGLALDYVPVMIGASQLPRYLPVLSGVSELSMTTRAVILILGSLVLAYILYRFVFRRGFVRMSDRNMAVLLERRFKEFHDSLVTSVELAERPERAEQFDESMLAHTGEEAATEIKHVRLGEIFDFRPLLRNVLGAAFVIVTIVAFYAVNANAFETWVNRMLLIKNDPWPRAARIEVVGVEILGDEDDLARMREVPLIRFEGDTLKVAKGSNLRLKVRADLGAKRVPEFCTVIYQTAEGDRGRVDMNKSKSSDSESQYQNYSFSGKPFQGILSSLRFDVRGYDFRVRDYHIDVVDSPTVVFTELDCKFPDYMVDEALSQWLPRTVPLTNATRLPRGTDVTLRATTNKQLRRVELYNPDTEELVEIDIPDDASADNFEYRIPSLNDDLTLDVTLFDVDGVVTERPHRLFIPVVADEPPNVIVVLKGISTAVTPDVIVPVQGEISDDYAVDKTWFDVELTPGGTNDGSSVQIRKFEFPLGEGGQVAASVDFREQRSQPDGIVIKPGDKLTMSVKAADKYDLENQPNVGSGDRYQLDVVTPDQLLAILESRELGLRRRFEQIIDEMSQARDSMVRVKSDVLGAGLEPGDVAGEENAEKVDEVRQRERTQSLRLLRTQQSLQQTRKSAQELLGVAASFNDIREELINNRVDTEDRKRRLKELVADPLQLIGETMFPELEARLESLEKVLLADLNVKKYDLQAGTEEAGKSVEQANDILAELDKVLQQMLDLETFNELLDIVRQIIDDQGKMIDRTEKQRKQDLLKDLQ